MDYRLWQRCRESYGGLSAIGSPWCGCWLAKSQEQNREAPTRKPTILRHRQKHRRREPRQSACGYQDLAGKLLGHELQNQNGRCIVAQGLLALKPQYTRWLFSLWISLPSGDPRIAQWRVKWCPYRGHRSYSVCAAGTRRQSHWRRIHPKSDQSFQFWEEFRRQHPTNSQAQRINRVQVKHLQSPLEVLGAHTDVLQINNRKRWLCCPKGSTVQPTLLSLAVQRSC